METTKTTLRKKATKIFALLFVVMALSFVCTTGCVPTHDTKSDSATSGTTNESIDFGNNTATKKEKMRNSIDMLCSNLKISEARAKGTMEILVQSGVSPRLEAVKISNDKQGIEAIVTDDNGKDFYLSFDETGFLELVRRDSAQGEIIFGIIE